MNKNGSTDATASTAATDATYATDATAATDATPVNVTVHSPLSGETTGSIPEKEDTSSETSGSEDGFTSEQQEALSKLPQAMFNYREVDTLLKDSFNYKESNHSMFCDIIGMYL